MSRAALTPTQTSSFCILFFSPAKTKHYQHLVMVHQRKAAAPSSAQVLCGAALAENMDPTTSRGPWKSIGTHWERNWWCLQDVCPRMSRWVSPGAVGHGRRDRNDGFARVLLQFAPCFQGLSPFVGQCQVTRDQFSMEQDECPEENLIPSLPQLQGRVCLNCGRV